MSTWLVVLLVLAVAYVLLELKTSRADGDLIQVHPYRRVMPYIMRTRNESIVYYDDFVDAENLQRFLERHREDLGCGVIHCLVAAVGIGLAEQPQMNRFVSGRRLYQRRHREITFSMKRKKLDRKAKLSEVKLRLHDGETFRQLCGRINGDIREERSDKKTHLDKELDFFTKLPRPVLDGAARFLAWLDYHNVLPYSFIEHDGMYASCFIANLGSLRMRAAYHHLYEWGNCPLFMMVGRIEDRPVVRDGEIVVRPILHIRWSYDERIDDGLNSRFGMDAVKRVLQDPERWLAPDEPLSYQPAAG